MFCKLDWRVAIAGVKVEVTNTSIHIVNANFFLIAYNCHQPAKSLQQFHLSMISDPEEVRRQLFKHS